MAHIHAMAEDTELGQIITVILECGQVQIFMDGTSLGVEIQTLAGVTVSRMDETYNDVRNFRG